MKFDAVFAKVADDVIASLEAGAVSGNWKKPWRTLRNAAGVQSVDRRPYRGINTLILGLTCRDNGLPWGTFNAWKKHQCAVRKGEKGTAVLFWKFSKYTDKKTGDEKESVLARSYTVFHASQVDGFDAAAWARPVENPVPCAGVPIPAADQVIEAWDKLKCPIGLGGTDVACYSPGLHLIRAPAMADFHSVEGYYSTIMHEIAHSTGKELKRDLSGSFGSAQYGKEELVAEMCSAMLCGALGVHDIDHDQHDEHKRYIAGWIKSIREDPKVLVYAAQRAQKAADLVLKVGGIVKQQVEQQEERVAA